MPRRRVAVSFSLFAFQDIITAVTGIILLITMTLAILVVTTSKAIPIEDRTQYHQELQDEIVALTEQRDALDVQLRDLSKTNAGLSRLSGQQLQRELEATSQSLKMANSRVDKIESQVAVLGTAWSEKQTRNNNLATALANRNSNDKSEINHIKQQLSEMRTSDRFFFNMSEESPKRAWIVQISEDGIVVAPQDGETLKKSYAGPGEFTGDLGKYPRTKNLFVLFVRPSGIEAYETIHEKLDKQAYEFGIDAIAETVSIVP